jgi:hypothetical protein
VNHFLAASFWWFVPFSTKAELSKSLGQMKTRVRLDTELRG